MKHPLLDHSWKTIGDKNELSKECIEAKIVELDTIFQKIERAEGAEIAHNTTDHGLIKHALVRCREYFNGNGSVSDNDYHIFFGYASNEAGKMQEMIDENQQHLKL